MINKSKPISYYINKAAKNKQDKNKSENDNAEEEKKNIDTDDNTKNNNIKITEIDKIDKKLSKLTYEQKIIYLKEKINEIKSKNGNSPKLLFDIVSKLISLQLTAGDLAFNKGDYNSSLEKYKECLQLNEPLPGSEWSKYSYWYEQRIIIYNSIASAYEKLNKKEQAIEYIKLSFNLQEKNNIEIENKTKFNDIIFLTGKQLILLGNYKEALKYLLKVEKNIYDEYNIEKIIKKGKIDENIDKKFLKLNPDEYIYLLNLIYKCCIKQKDYDLGENYYQRYEEMYSILSKIKKIKYPFKGIDEDSDEEMINIKEKINNDEENKSKSKFYKKINENILMNNNIMVDNAEDGYKVLPSLIQKKENSESKKSEKENEVNNNKEYINNYKEISWGKGKEENISSKKIMKVNKSRNSNSSKIPLPKNTNKIKRVNLSMIKDTGKNNNSNINNIKLNLNNSIYKLSKTKTISEDKNKKNSLKLPIPDNKSFNDKKPSFKLENLKQTVKEGKYYPPYDFVFKKPEKYNIPKNIPKLSQKKKANITGNNLFKNPFLPKIEKKFETEGNDIKNYNSYKSINLNRKPLLSALKKRSSSNKIENINRFVRIEEKLKIIEKNLLEKQDIYNKEISKNTDYKNNNNVNKKKLSTNISLYKINEEKNSKNEKNIKNKNKSSVALPIMKTNNIDKKYKRRDKIKTTKVDKDELIKIKNFKFPSQKKRKLIYGIFDNKEEMDNSSKNEHEEIKSLGSFISFGKKEENIKKKKKIKYDRNEIKRKTKIKSISIPSFKPTKIEINKNSKETKKIYNKLNNEGKLRFKSFQELIIKFFNKANLIISPESAHQNKKFNKYEKIYKKYEKNHIILNKIIDNYIYTITMYIPILNINITDNKKNEDKNPKKNFLETQITYKRNDSVFFTKYKINLPIIEENDFYNEELKEKIIDTLLNNKLNINFAWIIFLYYFENYFSTYKLDLENRARGIVNTTDTLFDEKNIGKNIYNQNTDKENKLINIQKDYIYYFVNIINKHLYNITQWKNKKILIGKKIDENESFCNLYYNILHMYINIYSDFLYLEDSITNKKIVIRNLEIESIKNRNKIILESIQNILNYSYDFKLLSQRLLLKKLFYNSFINTDFIKFPNNEKTNKLDNNNIDSPDNLINNKKENENIYIKKENQKMPLIDSLNIIQKFKSTDVEQYFFDNQIIYKGIIKMKRYDYMYLAISIRQFEKIILNQTKYKIVDYNILNLNARHSNVDIDNLHFLSNDKDIVKLYPKLNIDLTLKFYDITQYKSFLQLTLINLNPNSKWYDITYMPWEMYNYFISLLEDESNKKYLLDGKYSIEEIAKTQKMNSELGVLFYYFISDFCEIENGSLMIKKFLYKEDLYWKFFMRLYNLYDNYIFGLMLSEKYINSNIIEISTDIKIFYQNFLSKIHNYYYKLYFKENKYYIPEKIESNIDSDDEEFINLNKQKHKSKQKSKNKKSKENKNLFIIKKGYKDNYKSLFEKEEGNLSLTFNLYLKLGKNKYNAIFKFLKNRIYLTNDPENIKNYLLPTDYLPKVFIQLRSILSNELIQTNIYNIDLINNIKYMFDNNSNEKLLKTYFENLIHIANLPYGKKIIFDFLYNSFSLKSKSKNTFKENNLSILNKLSLILLHESNYNSSQMPENIILVKTYKTIFINEKASLKMLFNFRIYGDRQKSLETDKKKDIKKDIEESLYIKTFGRIKKSKLSEKLDKKYKEMENNKVDNYNEMFYYYLISIYFPKNSIKSLFILSTYDLQIILRKIKNKKIREEYLTTVDNFIRLIPNKISLQNTPTGQKIFINFSKYTELRTDWEKQLPMKNQKNKLLFEKKLNYIIDKKSQLKIFLKQNFVNLRTKESLYDISTDEMVLAIKKIKLYEINDKKLSCIVSIYYHKILDYWQIFLFFPFSSRKFMTILEPKHMENIYTDENLSQINKKEIKDKEIYEFIINKSKISYNFEEIAYLEILNMKLLLKELLYYGFELINDGIQSELNKVIYIEITIKALNLFTLDKIEKIIDRVEIENQYYLIFQSFSFHELYWHKENYKLEDLEPYYSKNIILEQKSENNNENIRKNSAIENNANNRKKLLPFCYLRKLINHIIQPYVNSQQHIFEKQMKLFKNKSIMGGDLQKLIDSTKYDRANQQKIANLYQQKLDNKIIFNKIYTETIRSDPPVIASVGINLVKEIIFITLYYPFKSKSYDIEIDFETVKKTFFPYFLDILSIDKVNLGKRILKRYQNFITKTPHFLKLFQPSN